MLASYCGAKLGFDRVRLSRKVGDASDSSIQARMSTMSKFVAVLAIVVGLYLPHSASARGPDGHRLVGSIADQLLSPTARQQVKTLLGVGLREAGPWLDCVKSVHRQADGSLAYVEDPLYEPPCTPFANDRAAMVD